MRNVAIGIVSALAGGALALNLSASPQAPSAPVENPAAPAATGVATSGAVLTPDAIDCTAFRSARECRAAILVRPGPKGPDEIRIKAVLAIPSGDEVTVDATLECDKGCSGDRVTFGGQPAIPVMATLTLPENWGQRFNPKVASGLIGVVSGSGGFEGTPKRLRILAPSPSWWQLMVVLIPGLFTFLTVTSAAVALREKKIGLDYRMGAPSWTAAGSWSSNFTVGTALVTGIVTAAVLSELTVFMTKPSYAVLSMLLASLTLLAPIVYGISRRTVLVKETPPDLAVPRSLLAAPPTETFEGTVRSFLAAGWLTLWASGGQLLTFALLMVELWRTGVLSAGIAAMVALLALVLFPALMLYGRTSMIEMGLKAKPPSTEVKAPGGREQRKLEDRPHEWSLL